jgi:hypothetical protein
MSNRGGKDRYAKRIKTWQAAQKDPKRDLALNHPSQSAPSFSFSFKTGAKEKFFLNRGKSLPSPLNTSLPASGAFCD